MRRAGIGVAQAAGTEIRSDASEQDHVRALVCDSHRGAQFACHAVRDLVVLRAIERRQQYPSFLFQQEMFAHF